jgi:membrane-associated phospholipid phosphatase
LIKFDLKFILIYLLNNPGAMNTKTAKTYTFHKLISDNKDFIIPFIVFTILSSVLLVIRGNDGLFLYINSHYSKFADIIFLNITILGDGIIAAVLVITLLCVSYRESLTFLFITLILAIVITVLKNYTFPELNRPLEYFRSSEVLRIVKGYDPPKLSTFPSGHAATVFSVCLYLSFLVKGRFVKFILFLTAFFVGFSRIYLSAHFPADILAGAIIGVSITILCYYLSRRITNSWIDGKIAIRPNIFAMERTK